MFFNLIQKNWHYCWFMYLLIVAACVKILQLGIRIQTFQIRCTPVIANGVYLTLAYCAAKRRMRTKCPVHAKRPYLYPNDVCMRAGMYVCMDEWMDVYISLTHFLWVQSTLANRSSMLIVSPSSSSCSSCCLLVNDLWCSTHLD